MQLIFEIITGLINTILIVLIPIIIILLVIFIPAIVSHILTFKKESKKFAKYSKKDLEIYYRELPANYSPAIVSALSNSKVEYKKDLPATILNLCAKGYLKIIETTDSFKFELSKKDTTNLLSHEKYIINKISTIHSNSFNYLVWQDLVIEDAILLKLIVDTDIGEKITGYKTEEPLNNIQIFIIKLSFILPFILAIICNVMLIFVESIFIWTFFSYILSFILPLVLTSIFSTINNSKSSFTKYERTKKGENDYIKWLGLKQFLQDYSLMHTRDIKEVAIWEYYLSYAIAFGLNKKTITSFDERVLKNNCFIITNLSKFINTFTSSKSYF